MSANKTAATKTSYIIWAIAAKDIGDALKSRNTLTTVVMVIFLMVLYRFVPVLWERGSTEIVIYEPAGAYLAPLLAGSGEFEVRRTHSRQELEDFFDDGDEGRLALVVPENLNKLPADSTAILDGYVLWSDRFKAEEMAASFGARISAAAKREVQIRIVGRVVPETTTMGDVRMIALMLLIAPCFIGSLAVPHLMIEEKKYPHARNLAGFTRQPRPDRPGQSRSRRILCVQCRVDRAWAPLAASCALGDGGSGNAAVRLVFGRARAVPWNAVRPKAQLSTWSLILFQSLLIPVFLSMIDPVLPEQLRAALAWVPTVSITMLYRFAFTNRDPLGFPLPEIVVAALSAAAILMAVVRQVRQISP